MLHHKKLAKTAVLALSNTHQTAWEYAHLAKNDIADKAIQMIAEAV